MASIELLTGSAIEAAVLQRSGPIALDFYQASCPPCRVLEPRLERIAQQYAGRISVYRVDIDRDLAVAERFGVTSLPTVLIFVTGNEVARLDGLITEAVLEAAFEHATGA
ncbi:MAG TPA: thioredoxin family protein [Herpetosiphonaceae bacterium]|nr:thioredoxin family protein [Herpetosiphonaceae bacterium]